MTAFLEGRMVRERREEEWIEVRMVVIVLGTIARSIKIYQHVQLRKRVNIYREKVRGMVAQIVLENALGIGMSVRSRLGAHTGS